MENIERKVKCLSCHKVVKAVLVQYGTSNDHYIGACPECGQLAHNGPLPAKEIEKIAEEIEKTPESS